MQYGVDDDCLYCFKSSLWTDRHKGRDTLTHICSMVLIMIVLFQVLIVNRWIQRPRYFDTYIQYGVDNDCIVSSPHCEQMDTKTEIL